MSKKRIGFIAAGILAVVAIAVGVIIWSPWQGNGSSEGPGIDTASDPVRPVAEQFVTAWEAATLDQVTFTPASGEVAGTTALITAGLSSTDEPLAPAVELGAVSGPMVNGIAAERDGQEGQADAAVQQATATATVTWDLGGDRTWTYDSSIALSRIGGRWLVDWTPAVVEPSLGVGELLGVERTAGARGRIVDLLGTVLRGGQGDVTVGIRPSRAPDPAATARTVAGLTGVDVDDLLARLAAAGPDDFVEVATLARADYDAIRTEIQPLPGTVFQESDEPGGLPPNFAKAVLGSTGTATDEIVAESDGRIASGDTTGLSGIEASQDEVLAGAPGLRVQAVSATPEQAPRVLETFAGNAGADVVVTLDQRTQAAADAAIATTAQPSALVAIRVSTGDVLAVANGPAGAAGFNRAMVGHYPPGSTFKVASAFGLLQKGLTPDTVVDCPASIVVGKKFTNAGGEVFGPVPFRKNFADSCNTAFVGRSGDITSQELTDSAASLGYRELDLGTPAFGGSVPVTDDATEHAADMIGQGKVEASPLAVALASASVANGSSLVPRLIVDPDQPAPTPGAGLPPEQIAQLRSLMRSVVTDGTGGAVAGVPGGEVSGKTGTAEFGNEVPPRTHASFTGYQGDIAFAVLVEDAGFGGSVAAPIAAQFLTTLAGP